MISRATFSAALLITAAFSTSAIVHGHGTILVPESRIYKCRFDGNVENHADPACRAAIDLGGTQAIYDWTAVRQGNANSQHQSVVPDGELCGGGNDQFRGMNLPRSDWRTTPIAPDSNGNFEFIYYATAAHATKDMIMYITKPTWLPGQSLDWDDLDEFCRFGDVPLTQDAANRPIYRMQCPLPERSGTHVIYNVWQRSDSPEAFYSCIDVSFSGYGNGGGNDGGNSSSDEICIPMSNQKGSVFMICF